MKRDAISPVPNKVRVFIRPAAGMIPERPISDRDFLVSMLDVGCWLRALAAYPHTRTQAGDEVRGELWTLGAAATMYQNTALGLEDVVSLLAASIAWEPKRDAQPALSLADLIATVQLGNDTPPADQPYHDHVRNMVREKARDSKRARIDGQRLLESLAGLRGIRLVNELGIPWEVKRVPSWMQSHERDEWRVLPRLFETMLKHTLDDPTVPKLLNAHNKLKHGPQMVVMTMRTALERRGVPCGTGSTVTRDRIRLLFDGANTQEGRGSARLVAPFLSDEIDTIRTLFYGCILGYATFASMIAKWLLRARLQDSHIPSLAEPLSTMFRESHALGFGSIDYAELRKRPRP